MCLNLTRKMWTLFGYVVPAVLRIHGIRKFVSLLYHSISKQKI